MNQEHAFVLAIEKLMGLEIPIRGSLIRVLYSEIGRVLNHLLNVTTQAMDVGAFTPSLWGFEEREKLMVFYERASGARMHANYFRPGGVRQDLTPALIEDIERWASRFPKVLDDIESLLTGNRIYKQRNVDIGVVTKEQAFAWGFTGVMLRGSRRRVGPAPQPALRVLRRTRVRYSGRAQRRQLRSLPLPRRRDAAVDQDHPPVRRAAEEDARAGAWPPTIRCRRPGAAR